MTTMTQLGPILVSELPPVPVQPLHKRVWRIRRHRELSFEQALRVARGQERTDLLAQERAQRTLTRTFT
jgi:hypothetical protein